MLRIYRYHSVACAEKLNAAFKKFKPAMQRGAIRKQVAGVMNDPHNLQRFVDAQSPLYEESCTELRAGQKRGHWIWFIFPQLGAWGRAPWRRS
jgi:hypothetical protein